MYLIHNVLYFIQNENENKCLFKQKKCFDEILKKHWSLHNNVYFTFEKKNFFIFSTNFFIFGSFVSLKTHFDSHAFI